MTFHTRSVLINLTLMVLAVSAAGALGELVLRRIYPYPQPQFLMPDPQVGWIHRPNVAGYFAREGLCPRVTTNSRALRDGEYALEKTSKKRIAVLGDSFTSALEVEMEQTYHGLLEMEFGDRIEVINFGVSGFGTCQELLMYRYRVRGFDPDIVVLAFYPGNDVIDNDKALSEGLPRPYCRVLPEGIQIDDSFRKSMRHTLPKTLYSVYYYLRDNLIIFALLDQLRYTAWPDWDSRFTLTDGSPGGESHLLYAPTAEAHRDAWSLTERLIVELAREVTEDGADFVLFVLDSMPSQLQEGIDAFHVEQRLGALCTNHHLICGFMAPEAVAHRRSGHTPLHGFGEAESGHWNPAGHRVAYRVLRRILLDQGLVPPSEVDRDLFPPRLVDRTGDGTGG